MNEDYKTTFDKFQRGLLNDEEEYEYIRRHWEFVDRDLRADEAKINQKESTYMIQFDKIKKENKKLKEERNQFISIIEEFFKQMGENVEK